MRSRGHPKAQAGDNRVAIINAPSRWRAREGLALSGGEGLAHLEFMTCSPQFVRRVDLVRSDAIDRELTPMRQPVRDQFGPRIRPITRSGEVSGSTTTISPKVGLTPESAWMFAPCVTTISVPSVHVFKIALASRLSSSRRSLNTKALLNAGSMSTGPRFISFAVSTQRREGYAIRPGLCAHKRLRPRALS